MKSLAVIFACVGMAMADTHPRLLFPSSMEQEVKQRIARDPLAAAIQREVLERAGRILDERTCEYRITDGKRLLSESRLALHHVTHCAWAWRTTSDPRFRDRVIRELDAACALKDWNPSHFLDAAEMSTAVAIGYDWLFPVLSLEQRRRYENSLLKFGLQSLEREHTNTSWWTGPKNNWSQVCGASVILAAEAVRERDPATCKRLAEHGKRLIESCKIFYQPDGAYPEGPSYWHYGTDFHVMALATCQSVGEPVEIPEVLRQSGDFMMHVVGPTRLPFNFADASARVGIPSPAQSWLASQFQDAGQALHVRSELESGLEKGAGTASSGSSRLFPLHLLWLPEQPASSVEPPLVARFRGEQPSAIGRTGWNKDAAWFAIKGGTGKASHAHLDMGSFVYDARGIRWFHDLGSDNYDMPSYFGSKRWSYLRLNNLSHNTLAIGGRTQLAVEEPCSVSAWKSQGPKHGVVIDLTPAYADQAAKVVRRAIFDAANGSVVIRDQIVEPKGPVRWAVVTKAAIQIDGPRAILTQSGKRLVLTRIDAAGGDWEEYSLKPATKEEQQNKGFRMLGFTAASSSTIDLQVEWKLD